MAARSPARFLAPLALLGFVFALALIVTHSSSSGSGSNSRTSQEQPFATPTATKSGNSTKKKASKGPRYYTVKSGDTPTGIAAKTGVSLSQIEQLNPSLDPQALTLGERVILRK